MEGEITSQNIPTVFQRRPPLFTKIKLSFETSAD